MNELQKMASVAFDMMNAYPDTLRHPVCIDRTVEIGNFTAGMMALSINAVAGDNGSMCAMRILAEVLYTMGRLDERAIGQLPSAFQDLDIPDL